MLAARAFILLAGLSAAIFPVAVVGSAPRWLGKVTGHRAPPRSSFWGIKGGSTPAAPSVEGPSLSTAASQASEAGAAVANASGAPSQPSLSDTEKRPSQEQQAPIGPPQNVLLDPHTLFLTDDDKAVYEQLEAAPTTDKLLSIAARIPAVRECPDYHLKITNAGRSDAFLAAYAVARLANTSTSEAEMESVISDRRFGQLIECISCQAGALSIVDVSNTLFGFSVLKCVEDTLLRSLTQTAIKALPTSTLEDAVRLAWSCAHASALIGFSAEALLEHVAIRVLGEWHKVPACDVSKLAWSMAVAGKGVDPLVHAIAHTAATNTSAFPVRDLTHVAWSLSSLGYKNVTVRDAIALASLGRMAELPVEDLAKHARSLALWGSAVDTLLLELLICAEAKKADLDASHTADVLWALGRANFRNASAFLARELPDVYQRMDAFSPQDLAKVLWSYATLLDVDDSVAPVLSSLAGRASVILERVTGQLEPVFLTQALWALATLGLHSQELGLRAATALEKRVSELSTGEVANLAWALAKLGSPRNPVLDQVAALMEARHADFSPRELCMCLWSLALCGYRLRFHSPLQLSDDDALKDLKPSEVSNLLWSLAKVSTSPPPQPLMDVLCADVKRKLATFSPHDITQVAWALSTLEQREHKVVTYVARAAQSWFEAFSAEQLATLTAALVHLNCPEQSVLDGIKGEMERRLLCLLSPPSSGGPLVKSCGPALDMADRPSQHRALFHLCRVQQLLLNAKQQRAAAGDVRKSGRYRYEIGKRALSTFF